MDNGKQIISELIQDQNRSIPKRGEIYKHFKGRYYIIEDIAYDTESNSEVVVYRALYGDHRLFVRNLQMFMEIVPSGYRFTKVESGDL